MDNAALSNQYVKGRCIDCHRYVEKKACDIHPDNCSERRTEHYRAVAQSLGLEISPPTKQVGPVHYWPEGYRRPRDGFTLMETGVVGLGLGLGLSLISKPGSEGAGVLILLAMLILLGWSGRPAARTGAWSRRSLRPSSPPRPPRWPTSMSGVSGRLRSSRSEMRTGLLSERTRSGGSRRIGSTNWSRSSTPVTSGSARTTRRRIWRARSLLPPLSTRTGTRWTSEADADEHSDRGVLLHRPGTTVLRCSRGSGSPTVDQVAFRALIAIRCHGHSPMGRAPDQGTSTSSCTRSASTCASLPTATRPC